MCEHHPSPDIRYGHLTCTHCGKVFARGLTVGEASNTPFYYLAGRFYDFK